MSASLPVPPALIVAGPTASGKSALALALAVRLGGVVINADAMQVYRELRILTARPSVEDEAAAPHALYGVRPAAAAGSAAWWREAALTAMEAARAAGLVPILCGGSGLYLAALIGGLAAIPDPGPAARAEARTLLAELGPARLHARLAAVDPVTAARLRPTDSQRVARAWEVWRSTGRGLAAWQEATPAAAAIAPPPAQAAPPAWRFTAIVLDPPRAELREAAAARFSAMLDAGAVGEVRALLALGLDPALPALRAHGVPELAAHLRGALTLEDATASAIAATGRYMKRQSTWLRHHALAPEARTHMIHARIAGLAQFSERNLAEIIEFIRAPA